MSDDQLCLDDPTRVALGGEPTWEGSCPPLQGDNLLDHCGLNFVQYKLTTTHLIRQCYRLIAEVWCCQCSLLIHQSFDISIC